MFISIGKRRRAVVRALKNAPAPPDAGYAARPTRLTLVADETDKQASTNSTLRRAQGTHVSRTTHCPDVLETIC